MANAAVPQAINTMRFQNFASRRVSIMSYYCCVVKDWRTRAGFAMYRETYAHCRVWRTVMLEKAVIEAPAGSAHIASTARGGILYTKPVVHKGGVVFLALGFFKAFRY